MRLFSLHQNQGGCCTKSSTPTNVIYRLIIPYFNYLRGDYLLNNTLLLCKRRNSHNAHIKKLNLFLHVLLMVLWGSVLTWKWNEGRELRREVVMYFPIVPRRSNKKNSPVISAFTSDKERGKDVCVIAPTTTTLDVNCTRLQKILFMPFRVPSPLSFIFVLFLSLVIFFAWLPISQMQIGYLQHTLYVSNLGRRTSLTMLMRVSSRSINGWCFRLRQDCRHCPGPDKSLRIKLANGLLWGACRALRYSIKWCDRRSWWNPDVRI